MVYQAECRGDGDGGNTSGSIELACDWRNSCWCSTHSSHKAWGGESSSSVMRAKAKPGTVSMAAAQQEPQRGTATKFMAKESKQEKLTGANSGPKTSKKKQNDELRALAFGGK
jgi:hypothetical protein